MPIGETAIVHRMREGEPSDVDGVVLEVDAERGSGDGDHRGGRRQEEPGRRDQLGTPSPPEPQGSRGGARLAARTQVADGHRKVLRVAVDPAGRPGTPGHAWTRLGMAAMTSVSSR